MDRQFVFHHDLAVISDMQTYTIDDVFNKTPTPDSAYVGHPTIFKSDPDLEGLQRGYQIIDADMQLDSDLHQFQIFRMPRAEYLFTIHQGTFATITSTYNEIEHILRDEKLSAVVHPILIFPRGLPNDLHTDTFIEIWTATDANYSAEFRRSDNIREALPRKRFNFYTW